MNKETIVIVESAGKIQKIQNILGKKYVVVSSVGHIMDLDKSNDAIDVNNNYNTKYISSPSQKNVICKIKSLRKPDTNILLATDKDREGEFIAWSLAQVLKIKNPQRIIFNSINEKDLFDAIKNARDIDMNIVNSQKTRRILDRLVGFNTSSLLISDCNIRDNVESGNKFKLSAGRVQSVVSRLIVDKENEIKEFMNNNDKSFFGIKGVFDIVKYETSDMYVIDKNKSKQILKGPILHIDKLNEAEQIMKKLKDSKYKINNKFNTESTSSPSAPFTTSTLQQSAISYLKFTGKRTMTAAQNLYEAGHITYMRTDSVYICDESLLEIKKYILKNCGEKYYKLSKYEQKKKNTQEAHEAIRPTNILNRELTFEKKIGNDEIKLYDLIWRTTIASQMEKAIYSNINIQIVPSLLKNNYFQIVLKFLTFDGYLKIYNPKEQVVEMKDVDLKIGDDVNMFKMTCSENYKNPPSRYSEVSLINMIDPKNLNIGRPSTYVSIISKILERKYAQITNIPGIEKEVLVLTCENNKITKSTKKIMYGAENKKYVPTDLGISVNTFMITHFPQLMDYKFTSNMEKNLDKIASGKLNWISILDDFYGDFNNVVQNLKVNLRTMENANKRILGVYPGTDDDVIVIKKNNKIYALTGKKPNGKIGEIIDMEFDNITFQDALNVLVYPKFIGKMGNCKIYIMKGKNGLYIKCSKTTLSIQNEVTLEQAIEMVTQYNKLQKDGLASFENDNYKFVITINNWNKKCMMVTAKSTNKTYTIYMPDDTVIEELTLDAVEKILATKFTNNKNNNNKPRGRGGYRARGNYQRRGRGF